MQWEKNIEAMKCTEKAFTLNDELLRAMNCLTEKNAFLLSYTDHDQNFYGDILT
jgi:hypothetical protein